MSERPIDKKRHYLPASSIGYFSASSSPAQLRQRIIWVLRKESETSYQTKAENVGFGKQIYGYGKGKFMDFDDYFKDAEKYINQPVERIMSSDNSWTYANEWLKLAWYISIQITRNPDLEREVEAIMKEKKYNASKTSVGYPLNAQRTSSAILRAKWAFLWSNDKDFILGDRGVTGTYFPDWKTNGYFVPLRKNFGVMLGPAPYKKQIKWFDNYWHIDIPAYTSTPSFTDKINSITWHASREEVYGSSREQLIDARVSSSSVPTSIQSIAPKYESAQLLGLSPKQRMDDEGVLIRMLGGIKEPEDKNIITHLTA